MKKTFSLLLIFSILSLNSCNTNESNDIINESEKIYFNDGNESITENITINSSPNNEIVSLLNGNIYEVSKNYTKYITADYYEPGTDLYYPDPVHFSFDYSGNPNYFTLNISTSKSLKDAASYRLDTNSFDLDYLFSGTNYYYNIEAIYDDYKIVSKTFSFETEKLPRTVRIDGVSNTRDIGGYITKDNKYRVKQGMVYRSATLDQISDLGINQMVNILKIKTDLDLRNRNEGTAGTISPLGNNVKYMHYPGAYYISPNPSGIDVPEFRDKFIDELKVFTDINNYPIDVHCSVGRDRTGTLIAFLLLILGVDENDVMLDYELSFLSKSGSVGNVSATNLLPTMENTLSFVKMANDKFDANEGAIDYLTTFGLSNDDINSIRNIMLEKK